jgi:hypothetical protein
MLISAVAAIGALGAVVGSAHVGRARRAEGEALDRELQGMLGTTNHDGPWADVIDVPAPRSASSHRAAIGAAGVLLFSVAYRQGVLGPALCALVLNVLVLVQVLRQHPLSSALTVERQVLIPIQ